MNILFKCNLSFKSLSLICIRFLLEELLKCTCGVRFVEMSAMLFTSSASDILNLFKSYLSVHLSLDNPRLMSGFVSK